MYVCVCKNIYLFQYFRDRVHVSSIVLVRVFGVISK